MSADSASYKLAACNTAGCTESAVVDVVGHLTEAVGYVKASNTGAGDQFGFFVAISGDGNTLAVSANAEDSSATGIGGNQADNSAVTAGAVYIFVSDQMGGWTQQAYIKASNTEGGDEFGNNVVLDGDGNTLIVTAPGEDSSAVGIGGAQNNNAAGTSGAAYVFARDQMGVWTQQAYVKASNTGGVDAFGWGGLSISDDGLTFAVAARLEDSNAIGINGNQANNTATNSGAVYVFSGDGMGAWSQQAYIKASNTGAGDLFGVKTALSSDGGTLAVGAPAEDSNAIGIGGAQDNNSAGDSGAVYVFVRDGMGVWTQQEYIKASNTGAGDQFGATVVLSHDGATLAVGAPAEDSSASGIDGDGLNNGSSNAGAAYVFTRDQMGAWSQQAYVKSISPSAGAWFHWVALDGSGDMLAVGAQYDVKGGIGVNPVGPNGTSLGAVYVYGRDGMGVWSATSTVTASNSETGDTLGYAVALDSSGETLVFGTMLEDSAATGVAGNQADNSAQQSGAVYIY